MPECQITSQKYIKKGCLVGKIRRPQYIRHSHLDSHKIHIDYQNEKNK